MSVIGDSGFVEGALIARRGGSRKSSRRGISPGILRATTASARQIEAWRYASLTKVKQKEEADDRKEKTMRLGVLFRIHQTIAAISLVILATEPAHALWLQVTGETLPVLAPLVVDLDSLKPPPGDTRHGLFAMPPSYRDTSPPRLKLQYRADFPRSVTFETDGAVTVERELPSG
ncbi:MAG TPA: hypothetical protein VHM01_24110, partial [Alphaproteobacteria bacterium]|nr:hypothetical protein [Alphaproteobacteria bacterium]